MSDDIRPIRDLFFEDLAVAQESWTEAVSSAMTDVDADLIWAEKPESFKAVAEALAKAQIPKEQIRDLLDESFRGMLVSVLTVIDGGTQLGVHARLRLVDTKRRTLGEGLHEHYVHYLMETGRLK